MTTTNPLHRYRTYSYHHILIACNTTKAAEDVSNLQGSQLFESIITKPGAGGRKSYDELSDNEGLKKESIDSGDYVIVFNGFTDGEFYISECSWETWLVPAYASDSGNSNYTVTVTSTGEMIVIEPRGFRFFNVINNAIRLLQSGTMGTVFVLKTVFVGNTDQRDNDDAYISDIRPMTFTITDMSAKFDEGGSRYVIQFCGQSNGIGKSPQFSRVVLNSLTIQSERNTLLDAINELAARVNEVYNTKIDEALKAGQITLNDQRKVNIIIELAEPYTDSTYIIDKMLIDQSGKGSNIGGGTITFGRNSNIEQMIYHVMTRCSQVINEANEKPNKIFKIYTTVESDLDQVNVKFYVKQMFVPESPTGEGLDLLDGTDYDLLEFDYMYTGKNVDILDMQINMDLGYAFFQMLEVVEPATDDQSLHNKTTKADTSRSVAGPDTIEARSPVLPIKPQKRLNDRSVKDPLKTSSFVEALNKFAEMETLENTIIIHGNPRLLNSLNVLPSEFGGSVTSADDDNPLARWTTVPSMCKINISMPSNNSLLGVGPTDQFQTPFWYQGLYTILFIQHKFKSGEFTQQLTMKNIPSADDPIEGRDYKEKTQVSILEENVDE